MQFSLGCLSPRTKCTAISISMDNPWMGLRTRIALLTRRKCSNICSRGDSTSDRISIISTNSTSRRWEARSRRGRRNSRRRKGNFGILQEQHPEAIGIGLKSKKRSSQYLGTVRNWESFLGGKNARPEPIRLEIRNDRSSVPSSGIHKNKRLTIRRRSEETV
jgi:hypothetical protein